jgi:hypothetical protein
LQHYGIPRSELRGWLFCANPKLAKLAEMKNNARAIGALEQQIRAAIARRNPDILSLDPFVKTHALEESASGDMDFVCDLLARLAIEFNIAVDSPHHSKKGPMTPGDADSGRGSSGIRDAARLVYTLVPMSEQEAKTFSIDDRSPYIRLDSAKVNIAPRSDRATWFKIVGVPIGNSTDEYPSGDMVQVVESWSPPNAWSDVTPTVANAILNEIARGLGGTGIEGQHSELFGGESFTSPRRYSNAPAAGEDRAAWPVVRRHCPDKPEGDCRRIIHTWIENGVLLTQKYFDPVERKERSGLFVDDTKRPT